MKKTYKYDIDLKTILMCVESLQGKKDLTKWTKQDYQKNIDVDNCRYDTTAYEANEYLLDDGSKILIHFNLTKISRTKLYDNRGDRIYFVKSGAHVTHDINNPQNL